MSEIRLRDWFVDEAAPIPYRTAEGLRINSTSKGIGGSRTHFVKSRTGEICQLGEEEYFIFTLLDGNPSFSEIQSEFRSRFAGELSRRHFQAFIDELVSDGIIERTHFEPPIPVAPADLQVRPEADIAEPDAETLEPIFPPSIPPEAPDAPLAARVWLSTPFMVLATLGSPLRFYVWLLIPGMAVAGFLLAGAQTRMIELVTRLHRWDVPGAAALLLACWLIPRLAAGAAAWYHGAPDEMFRSRSWGGGLLLDRTMIPLMPRKAVFWTYAAPMSARLALLVSGAALFASHPEPASRIGAVGMVMAQYGLWSWLLSAIPLWPGDGRRSLTAYFDHSPESAGVWRITAGVIGLLLLVGQLLPWIGLLTARPLAVPGDWLDGVGYGAMLLWLWLAIVAAPSLIDQVRPQGAADVSD